MSVNENPIDVDERLEETTFKLDERRSADDMIALLEEAKRKHLKLRWTNVKVGLERRSKEEIDLVIFGSRKESQDEANLRIAREKQEQKFKEDQELKEYLRLKRKFEKDGN